MAQIRFEAVGDGAVAFRDGEEAARLTGGLREHEVLGRQAWLTAAGDPALWPDLYALAAAPWVADGYVSHQVAVAADDEAALETWFSLCFGKQQVYGEQPVRPSDFSSQGLVRAGTLEDALAVGNLIAEAQVEAPVWSGFPPSGEDELREAWKEALEDPRAHYLVADADGRAAGHALFRRGDEEANLAVAATRPEARGLGLGTLLLEAGMAWAYAQGLSRLTTDWRSTNLFASRFWPRRGFRPTRYRLHRYVAR